LAQNVYECMFIFDSNNYARDPSGVSGRVPKMVSQCGGEVLASRLWNEQKLAYPIKGHRKGTYWLSYFRLDSDRVPEFRRACQLNDDIVRSLMLKVDPRLVETLVAHARGEVLVRPKVEEEPRPELVLVKAGELDAVDEIDVELEGEDVGEE
jgi:small subunit ribosomal protein S6